jgi:branched-chain amino acid transport system permease protein
MAILTVKLGMTIWLAALLGLVLTAVIAALIGLTTVRLRADYFAIALLAFAEIVRYVAIAEHRLTGGAIGTINLLGPGQSAAYNAEWLSFQSSVQALLQGLFGDFVTRNMTMALIIWLVALSLFLLHRSWVRSPWGRVLMSIREDEDAAAAVGKNILSYKVQSLVVGAVFGGIAGLMYAFAFSFFSPDDFHVLLTFYAWVIIILGGTTSYWGPALGSFLFAILWAGPRFLNVFPFTLLDSPERAYVRMIIIGLLLIGLMLFRPQGILGKREEMVLQ